VHKSFHQELGWSIKEAEMDMLKECVLDVVKKGTMPIDVQQSIRGLDPVILDYIASSMEKTDILSVDVKKGMIINPMTQVPIAMHLVRRHQLAPCQGR
jgi:hypothetical protein